MFRVRYVASPLLLMIIVVCHIRGQSSEMANLLHDAEVRAAEGSPRSFDEPETEAVMERFEKAKGDVIEAAMPSVLQGAASQYPSVRRIAAMDLLLVSVRPESGALLSEQTALFRNLLVDADIPSRRLAGMALANLRVTAKSELVPDLQRFLSREDAVQTIGAGVAGLLINASPDDPATTAAIVQYMQRKDQSTASRLDLLESIRVARSHSRGIGKVVAIYAKDPNKVMSVQAIQTLHAMGEPVVSDNREVLQEIAADSHRDPDVRSAAKAALSETF